MAEKYGRKVKELMIKEAKDVFSNNKGFVFSSISKVKASEVDAFRKKIRQSGSRFLVLKNRLAKIALKEAGIGERFNSVSDKNTIGISVIKDDPVKLAKLVMEFSKANTGFQVSEGYLEGQVLGPDRIKELSKLPGRGQLVSMVLGTLNAPITNLAGSLSSVLRSIIYAVDAIRKEKGGSHGEKC